MNARRMVPLTLVLLLSLVLLPAATGAQEVTLGSTASPAAPDAVITPLFSYQGRLLEGDTPVTGIRSMTFSLWTDGSGGSSVWTEGPQSVSVSSGLFTVTLGGTAALPVNAFASELWLEVQVGATTLPRQRLMGSPYAMSLAPGAQIAGSKPAGDPAIVNVQNTGAGDVLRLTAGGGRPLLVQNNSSSQLFTVEANGDATQIREAGGLVKVAISAYCGDDDAYINRYFTHGNAPSVWSGGGSGRCTINPGIAIYDRYWSVIAPASGSIRLASCAEDSGNLVCVRQDINGNGVNGEIQVLIY